MAQAVTRAGRFRRWNCKYGIKFEHHFNSACHQSHSWSLILSLSSQDHWWLVPAMSQNTDRHKPTLSTYWCKSSILSIQSLSINIFSSSDHKAITPSTDKGQLKFWRLAITAFATAQSGDMQLQRPRILINPGSCGRGINATWRSIQDYKQQACIGSNCQVLRRFVHHCHDLSLSLISCRWLSWLGCFQMSWW